MTRSAKEAAAVLALREQGLTYREIESLTGIARMTASRMVARSGRDPGRRPRMDIKLPRNADGALIYPDIDPEDKDALIARMALEIDVLRAVNDVLKAGSLRKLSNREKSLVIEHLRQTTGRPLKELTGSLRISKSSYEYWRSHLGDVDVRERIGGDVERIFEVDGRGARGYRFVAARLAEEMGRPVSEKIVRDVMRARGLRVSYAGRRRRYCSYGGETDQAPPNLPLREDGTHDFHADEPCRKWVSDITEFKLPNDAKVYLSPVLDLFDGKPVGWSIGRRPDARLANSSLEKALAASARPPQWCHTDRGCHYRWPGWKRICEENGIARSMSRKGRSPDNARMEGFFGLLKKEFFYGRDWSNVTPAEFSELLDEWMRYYSESRLRLFDEDGEAVYDTIDNRRRRLGYAV